MDQRNEGLGMEWGGRQAMTAFLNGGVESEMP
jgi:hypothetical protein